MKITTSDKLTKINSSVAACTPIKGTEIKSPISGVIENVTDKSIKINYSSSDCKFSVIINHFTPDKNIHINDNVEEGDEIGKATGEQIKLSIKKGLYSNENIDSYLSGEYCPSKKTSTDNKTSSGTNKKETTDDLGIMNPYKVAALPFLGLQKGAKAIMRFVPGLSTESEEEITNIVEEVNRIKQLMK
jgi:hypothetical protein